MAHAWAEERQLDKAGQRIPAARDRLLYWSLHCQPATVVMPTGTGKTEAMIAACVAYGAEPLLIYSTDSARDTLPGGV